MLINNIGFLLGTAHMKYRNVVNIKLAEELNITVETAGVLFSFTHEKLTQLELTELLQRDKSTIKRLVDNCIKNGFLVIDACSTHKNRVLILTKTGQQAQQKADKIITEQEGIFFKHLKNNDKNNLETILKSLLKSN